MTKRIATLRFEISLRRAGNVIMQHTVDFELYGDNDNIYILVPYLDKAEREVANLPKELRFVMQDGKPVSLRGLKDGNLHVIQRAVEKLKEEHQLNL